MKKEIVSRKIGTFSIKAQLPIDQIKESDVPWNSALSQDQMLLPHLDSNLNFSPTNTAENKNENRLYQNKKSKNRELTMKANSKKFKVFTNKLKQEYSPDRQIDYLTPLVLERAQQRYNAQNKIQLSEIYHNASNRDDKTPNRSQKVFMTHLKKAK